MMLLSLLVVCFLTGTLAGKRQSALAPIADEFQNQIVNWHNKIRREVGATAMNRMDWDTVTAELIAPFAKHCRYVGKVASGNQFVKKIPADGEYDVSAYINEGLKLWGKEMKAMVKNGGNTIKASRKGKGRKSATKKWSHNMNVARAGAYKIGCYYATCEKTRALRFEFFNLVCGYMGSTAVGFKQSDGIPFKAGTACSECQKGQKCKKGLCVGHKCEDLWSWCKTFVNGRTSYCDKIQRLKMSCAKSCGMCK